MPKEERLFDPTIETAKTLITQPVESLEVLPHLFSQTYGLPATGIAMGLGGIAGLPFGKGKEWAEKAGEFVGRSTIYQPQTEAGRKFTEATFSPFELLSKASEKAADVAREAKYRPSPSEYPWMAEAMPFGEHVPTAEERAMAGTVAGTAMMSLPLLLGLRKHATPPKYPMIPPNVVTGMKTVPRPVTEPSLPVGLRPPVAEVNPYMQPPKEQLYFGKPTDKGEKISASKIVQKIVRETEGQPNVSKIRETIFKDGSVWIEKSVQIDGLKRIDDIGVKPELGQKSKGAIVVLKDGTIIDGRHRVALARSRGETSIRALVPIEELPPTVKRAELFGLKEGIPELEPTRKALEPIKEMRRVESGMARMQSSEWSKNPELVADAKLAAEKVGVSPDTLEYVGLQKFTPLSNDAMHLWNVTDPKSPKYQSTVAGPTFQLTGEQTKRLRPLGILKGERGSLSGEVKPGTLEYTALSKEAFQISQKEKAGTATPEDLSRRQKIYEKVGIVDKPKPVRTREDIQNEIDDLNQELLDHRQNLSDAAGDAESQASIRMDIVDSKAEIAILKKELRGSLPKGERGSLGEPNAPTWYSTLQRTIETKMPNSAPVEQVKSIITSPGVKADEVKWTGLDDYLTGKTGKVSKQEVMEHLKQNEVRVEEVTKSGKLKLQYSQEQGAYIPRPETTKFSQWQLPGGENYRELVLTSNKVTAGSSHAYDNPNHFAWTRFNDRVDSTGKKVLMLEEIQEHDIIKEWRSINKLIKENKATTEDIARKADIEQKMPFVRNWQEVAMRRMVRWAAENGYDKVAWTTGEQQAARYDLSKHVEEILAKKNSDGSYMIGIKPKGATQNAAFQTEIGGRSLNKVQANELDGIVGKDLADKIREGVGFREAYDGLQRATYFGLDLKVGGEGMKGFYDKILPDYMNKFGKKWGAKVGETNIPTEPPYAVREISQLIPGQPEKIYEVYNRQTGADRTQFSTYQEALKYADMQSRGKAITNVHSLDITPSMKKSVLEEGLPLFQLLPPALAGAGLITERLTREKRKSQSSKQNVIRSQK